MASFYDDAVIGNKQNGGRAVRDVYLDEGLDEMAYREQALKRFHSKGRDKGQRTKFHYHRFTEACNDLQVHELCPPLEQRKIEVEKVTDARLSKPESPKTVLGIAPLF